MLALHRPDLAEAGRPKRKVHASVRMRERRETGALETGLSVAMLHPAPSERQGTSDEAYLEEEQDHR